MFGLGLPEMIIIGFTGMLLFGAKRLPELAKGAGKGIRDFRKALDGEPDEAAESERREPARFAP